MIRLCTKDSNIKLSFLICTLNRDDDLKRSISSLFSEDNHDVTFEVIVVDQGCSDTASEICSHFGATYIPTNSRGLSIARNIGLGECHGEFVALMDDDAYISANYFSEMKSILEENTVREIDAFSGRMMTIENPLEPLSRYQGPENRTVKFSNIDSVLSSALVIRRATFDAIGNFDEDFGIGARWGGSEETDLLARILHNQGFVKYFPSLRVLHPRSNFSEMHYKDILLKAYTYGLGRGAFIKKNDFLPWFIIFKSLLIPLCAFLISLLFLRPKAAARYISSFWGRLQGFNNFQI